MTRNDRPLSLLHSARFGIAAIAVAIGVTGGFGAVAFRWCIFGVTWVLTGSEQFGQAGRLASSRLPWLGIWFLLVAPVVGGLLYGPLIRRFAPEARGHGVPEVMAAVEAGGRIRPQVTVVKAVASALCIGTGGSVGREGPIVQIGSALASSLGQLLGMAESRLRVLVACGAAAGISATFNAPVTGVFFAVELILRDHSSDGALPPIVVSSVVADAIGRIFFGSGPVFGQMPHDLMLPGTSDYFLVALLGLVAALVGVGFKSLLYRTEDICDRLWGARPEWCRPAVGGVLLGALLLALPQLYGVGYPVMDKAVAGQYVLWFLMLLVLGKALAASLTIGIGGSGGVFAPSLFIGAMAGTAFGVASVHAFGPGVGSPAAYGIIAMGAVFAAAAQAPMTAIASGVEMTGNYLLTFPILLAVGLATEVSRRLTHGTIYTTKLLRRGIDVDVPGRLASSR